MRFGNDSVKQRKLKKRMAWKPCRSCGGTGWYRQPYKGKGGVPSHDGEHLSCRCSYVCDENGVPSDPANIEYLDPSEECTRCKGTGIFLARCNCAKNFGKPGLVWVPNEIRAENRAPKKQFFSQQQAVGANALEADLTKLQETGELPG